MFIVPFLREIFLSIFSHPLAIRTADATSSQMWLGDIKWLPPDQGLSVNKTSVRHIIIYHLSLL